MLGNRLGKRIVDYVKDYVLFDLETTGTSPTKDDVIEISAVKVRDGVIVDEFTTLVNPERPIPIYASNVNGIYDDMVADAPLFEVALKNFDEFVGEDILVGHNIIRFDLKFINRDAQKFWGKTFTNDYLDTLEMSWKCLPELEKHTLGYLADYFDISSEGAHRALNDCKMNQAVLEKMKEVKNNPSTVKEQPVCPKCGNILRKRKSVYGAFYGCSSYPACKYTQNI